MFSVGNPGWLDKERPACGPLDAIVRPTIIAPCTSDTHTMHGGSGPKENLILGHEAVGIINEVGPDVTRFKPGDYVVVPACTPDWLQLGIQNKISFSHDAGPFGGFKFLGQKDGVMAEYFHVNQADANLAPLPEGVSPEAALMTVDMMSTGFYGAEMAEVAYGDTVVVYGIGPVGLMAIAGAALRGAGQIIAVGTRPASIEVAKDYGANAIVSYKEGKVAEQILELTSGGPNKTIIAGGNPDTFAEAIAITREKGFIANINFFDVKDILSFPAMTWGLGMADKTIRGGFCPGGAERLNALMRVIKYRNFDAERIISHRFHGFDAMEEAFHLMDKKAPDLIKPIVYTGE
jgi:threonine dehydrogenase-like Zn-dependent dehydrogenase